MEDSSKDELLEPTSSSSISNICGPKESVQKPKIGEPSIHRFWTLKCPECVFDSKEENEFRDHARQNHPHSSKIYGEENSDPSSEIGIEKRLRIDDLGNFLSYQLNK